MKMNDVSSESGKGLQLDEQYFSIENQGMIFDILRNKMYSNPILAICREITCNARDAHREIGSFNRPIQVYLPNQADPFLKIKDFGPGISPERISNIFIKYAASTKRNDNIQTGGFGLGAKTPFSYSDSFNIVTCHNGIKYEYICFIDETKIGKISLLSEENTSEPNGTEIVIPVKSSDFVNFNIAIEQVTRHWSVRPIVKDTSNSFKWKELNVSLSGDGWNIAVANDWNRNVKAIIDEIEYPIQLSNVNSIKHTNSTKMISELVGDLYLYFNVGDLSLSANREQIYFDNATKQKISQKIDNFIINLFESAKLRIDQCADLWSANILCSKIIGESVRDSSLFPDLYWRGVPLYKSGRIDLPRGTVVSYVKHTRSSYYSYHSNNSHRIKKEFSSRIVFSEKNKIVINDLGIQDFNTKNINKIFAEYPECNCVQIVCGTDKAPLNQVINNYHLNLMSPLQLSNYAKVTVKRAASSTRLIVYKFDTEARCFKQVAGSLVDSDTNKKVICALHKQYDKNYDTLKINDKFVPIEFLKQITVNYPEYSIYGVDATIPQTKTDSVFTEAQNLQEFVEEILDNNQDIDYLKLAYSFFSKKNNNSKILNHAYRIVPLISSNSLFSKTFLVKEELRNYSLDKAYLIRLYELMNSEISNQDILNYQTNNPEINVQLLISELEKKYPLLLLIDDYNWSANIDHIVQYINLIDSNNP